MLAKISTCIAILMIWIGNTSLHASEAHTVYLTKDAIDTSVDIYPLKNRKDERQFTNLLKELRCLVCQNQDLSDSNAPLAKDLRRQVYDMVNLGKSDQEIINYLTDRYGDFVLFKPPVKPLTYILWLCPFLFLALGLVFFIQSFARSKANE